MVGFFHTYWIEIQNIVLCKFSQFEQNREVYGYSINEKGKDNMQIRANNPDLVGDELIPIASFFAGDYVCLDFTDNRDEPSICVWNHENSGEFEPVTYKVANTFAEFLEMLV